MEKKQNLATSVASFIHLNKEQGAKDHRNAKHGQLNILFVDSKIRSATKVNFNSDTTCDYCCKTFALQRALDQHQEATGHFSEGWSDYTCHYCERDFRNEDALYQHQRDTGHDEDFTCDYCGRYFYSEKALEQHQNAKGHYDEEKYTCNYCEREFVNEDALYQHQRAKGHETITCKYCWREFKSERALEQHEEATGHERQLKQQRVICRTTFVKCKRTFANDNAWLSHWAKTTVGTRKMSKGYSYDEADPDDFICDTCGKVFSGERSLEQHQEAKRHGFAYTCYQCDRFLKNENALTQHQRDTGHEDISEYEYSYDEEEITCHICDKVFDSGKLEKHLSRTRHQQDDFDYYCHYCNRQLETSKEFQKHIEITKCHKKRMFGYYGCSPCKRYWCSGNSWVNYTQKCESCDRKLKAQYQRPLKSPEDWCEICIKFGELCEDHKQEKAHPEELCAKCKELGFPCKVLEAEKGKKKNK